MSCGFEIALAASGSRAPLTSESFPSTRPSRAARLVSAAATLVGHQAQRRVALSRLQVGVELRSVENAVAQLETPPQAVAGRICQVVAERAWLWVVASITLSLCRLGISRRLSQTRGLGTSEPGARS